jgi:hypothetical protein
MGFSADAITQATVNGKPLADSEPKPIRQKLPPKRRELSDAFIQLWKNLGPPIAPEREFYFAKPRRFRFDVCWPAFMVACELEGGIWVQGRHTRGAGFTRDMEKYNLATSLGWRLLRFAINDLEGDPIGTVEKVAALLKQ